MATYSTVPETQGRRRTEQFTTNPVEAPPYSNRASESYERFNSRGRLPSRSPGPELRRHSPSPSPPPARRTQRNSESYERFNSGGSSPTYSPPPRPRRESQVRSRQSSMQRNPNSYDRLAPRDRLSSRSPG